MFIKSFFDVKGRTIETGLYIGEDINKVISNPLLNILKLNDIVFGLEKICKLWGLGFEKNKRNNTMDK